MMNRRPEPDNLLLEYLWERREYAADLEPDGEPEGIFAVTLDPDRQQHTTEELWSPEVPRSERVWLSAFAAVTSILSFSAYLALSEQNDAVRRLARGHGCPDPQPRSADPSRLDDITMDIEIYGTRHGQSVGAFLTGSMPLDVDVRAFAELILRLRKHLINHPNPAVVAACGAAYEGLANDPCEGIGDKSLPRRIEAHDELPIQIIDELRREEVV